MRVLFVTPSYFPIVGGSEVLTQVLSNKLNKLGIHSDIMTFNMNVKWKPVWKEERVEDGPAKVFREPALNLLNGFPNPLSNIFRTNVIPKLTFTSKFRNYDVIHFVGEADLSFPLFSFFIRKPKLIQCVGVFRKGGIYKYYTSTRPFLGAIFKKFFPRIADRFLISSLEEKELLSEMGVPQNRITILPIGVDTAIFEPDPTKKSENIVLFVGRIDRIKGLHILLKALPYIEIPVKLIIIGPLWDPEYVKEIEEMSNAINKTGFHTVTLLGEMESNDLAPWYQKAAVLVCPYLYETYSNVIRESLACGTPVVSTGSHIFEDRSDGILLSSQNPIDLANTISKLLNEQELRAKLGKEARKMIEQCFSWDSVIKDLIEIYEDMLR